MKEPNSQSKKEVHPGGPDVHPIKYLFCSFREVRLGGLIEWKRVYKCSLQCIVQLHARTLSTREGGWGGGGGEIQCCNRSFLFDILSPPPPLPPPPFLFVESTD